ncbi:hypothetical protein R5R35_002059 [Gryllus longicercus]|uniref:Juvenile hormone esterase binding protein n=1 Tax=Gryllus longicercus TaxID=2509291 RepID=A0AAN9VI15_9ORTH
MAASLCSSQVINNKLSEILRRRICLKQVQFGTYSNRRLLSNLGARNVPFEGVPRQDRYPNFDVFCEAVRSSRSHKYVYSSCSKLYSGANERTQNISGHILHTGKYTHYSKDRGKTELMISQVRWNSSGNPAKSLPPLMNFPEIVWPSVIKTVKNRVLSSFIITPYFDREFRLSDFVQGSKQAVQCVSSYLSRGDYNSLEGLVTKDALSEVKRNMSLFSVEQRHDLFVDKEDIYFSFPYQIGIMFNDDDQNQQRFVEITMVYHILHGLKEMRAQDINPPLNLGMLPEYQDKLHLCNYRFIREFTKGVESDWTVNVVNHFKPVDQIRS